MAKQPTTVRVNLFFILINAILWLMFGVIIIANLHPALPDQPYIKQAMAFMSFIFAALLFVSVIFLRRQNRIAYYLLLMFFAFVTVLTVFDNLGYSDLLVLVINIIPIVLLIKDRNWYLQMKTHGEGVS